MIYQFVVVVNVVDGFRGEDNVIASRGLFLQVLLQLFPIPGIKSRNAHGVVQPHVRDGDVIDHLVVVILKKNVNGCKF